MQTVMAAIEEMELSDFIFATIGSFASVVIFHFMAAALS